MANYRENYINRVMFLTDGRGSDTGLFQMAESYAEIGVGLSTVGLGMNFDLNLMRELAMRGRGTSRFINDRETMVETFGTGLSRTIVPLAREVLVTVKFAPGVDCTRAWSYEGITTGRKATMRFPALYMGDYETSVLQVSLPPHEPGEAVVARVETSYEDLEGNLRRLPTQSIRVEVVDREWSVDGISDAVVLRAGTMLRYARALKEIGAAYYNLGSTITAHRTAALNDLVERTHAVKKEVHNARARLDEVGFEDELQVLDNYLCILGGDVGLSDVEVAMIRSDVEIRPAALNVPFVNRLEGLFDELALDLEQRAAGNVAVSGFARSDGKNSQMAGFLDEMAGSSLAGRLTVVERKRIDQVLAEQELSISDLMETNQAIQVGRLLAADYILTGTIVPMQSSVVIFSRVINSATGEVETAAQVIVPIDAEVRTLL
jgi:hypothetical protein